MKFRLNHIENVTPVSDFHAEAKTTAGHIRVFGIDLTQKVRDSLNLNQDVLSTKESKCNSVLGSPNMEDSFETRNRRLDAWRLKDFHQDDTITYQYLMSIEQSFMANPFSH